MSKKKFQRAGLGKRIITEGHEPYAMNDYWITEYYQTKIKISLIFVRASGWSISSPKIEFSKKAFSSKLQNVLAIFVSRAHSVLNALISFVWYYPTD